MVKYNRIFAVAGLALYLTVLLAFSAGGSGGLEPTPGPTPAGLVQPQPIIPSDTSTTVTQIALLMVASGGVLAAIPPIIRALRKDGDDEDEEKRVREMVAFAQALREADENRRHDGHPDTG